MSAFVQSQQISVLHLHPKNSIEISSTEHSHNSAIDTINEATPLNNVTPATPDSVQAHDAMDTGNETAPPPSNITPSTPDPVQACSSTGISHNDATGTANETAPTSSNTTPSTRDSVQAHDTMGTENETAPARNSITPLVPDSVQACSVSVPQLHKNSKMEISSDGSSVMDTIVVIDVSPTSNDAVSSTPTAVQAPPRSYMPDISLENDVGVFSTHLMSIENDSTVPTKSYNLRQSKGPRIHNMTPCPKTAASPKRSVGKAREQNYPGRAAR